MPREIVTIPLNDPVLTVQVVALYKGKDAGPFAYLQSMRSGVLKTLNTNAEDTETARTYHRREGGYQQMLADALPTDADAVISPPSRMAWQAEPYRQAIRRKNPSAVDLTPRLTRDGNAFAGGRATVAEVTAQLRYVATGQESKISRLIIVDDTFTKGTTAAAIVSILRAHGLEEGCKIVVACPLWLNTFAP